MHQLNVYLFFDGNCADAMRFYERTLNGKLDLLTHADSPMKEQSPPGSEDKIMHARLTFDGGTLMASDWLSDQPYPGSGGFALSLMYPTTADARRMFDTLSDGGRVTMPFQKTFWAEGFGMVIDRFGTHWMLNGGMAGK
ncbi:MAG TPA: VOC family protein [Casimicrobiaceae bacterium]